MKISSWWVLGAMLGFVASSAVSCGGNAAKCGPQSCPFGCCDTAGSCQVGSSDAQCGSQGNACSACSLSQRCSLGQCSQVGSTGGGSGQGGGSASGGGFGGGGASTGGSGGAAGGGNEGTGGGGGGPGGGGGGVPVGGGGGGPAGGGGGGPAGGGGGGPAGGGTGVEGETCATATQLMNAGLYVGTTVGASNDYAWSDTGLCQGGDSATPSTGGDRVYRISVPAMTRLEVAVMPETGFDATLNLISASSPANCGPAAPTCLAGADDPEQLTWDNGSAMAVSVFVVVDSYAPGAAGMYSIGYALTPLSP